MSNYFVYHLHSDLSNGTTNIDSVTKFSQYIERAKELGMQALAFSEHGNIFSWAKKKWAINDAGMKYVHAVEAYITMTLETKVRDNYHCVLLARNYEGVKEINRLVSKSFLRDESNHFYYAPRVSMEELEHTSDNIIITTACLGGALHSDDEKDRQRFLRFCLNNKNRVFLEIQHHLDPEQAEYNQYLYELSKQYGIRLIAGTDTHNLNDTHAKGRQMLQRGKGVRFPSEENWDLTFKTYDELCLAYRRQRSLPEDVWRQAIENTNVLAEMVEDFDIDCSIKYPNVFENPDEQFRKVVYEHIDTHPYALKNHTREELVARVEEELDTFKKIGASAYMLLKYELTMWEHKNDIYIGYGRGSVNGSMVAYLLGITDMDSMRYGLNFFRFANPNRVTQMDIDSDYSAADRDRVKSYLLDDHMGYDRMRSAEIITFNTIATKGAIRDIGRAFGLPLDEVGHICDAVDKDGNVDVTVREKYKELFEYVDIVSGTVVSVGSHPCGILITDHDMESEIGLCTTSGSPYPVTCLYMKELERCNFIKWDVLGLDNVALINQTCKMAGIERLTPDNTDMEDMDVWRSIRDDTTTIFQWESGQASAYIRHLMSDNTLDIMRKRSKDATLLNWMSIGNALLRPGCASFRDEMAEGIAADNGLKELNDFLSEEAGHTVYQETIMRWCVEFCGYSEAESDNVRRAIAKKTGTEQLLPEIERRFIEHTSTHYNVSREKCAEIIKPFLVAILQASAYSFSKNHALPYSCIGYICGYLRYYYPLEFIATALNVFADNTEKLASITEYAQTHHIKILPPKFGYSGATYTIDKEANAIYKGVSSIKYMNSAVADALYYLSHDKKYDSFMDLLMDVGSTGINSRQLGILINLDYFSDFGNARELTALNAWFDIFKQGTMKTMKKEAAEGYGITDLISRFANGNTKSGKPATSWTITDMGGILKAVTNLVHDLSLKDYDFRDKAHWQNEYLGYIDLTSGKQEDRKRLYISDLYKLKSKKDNKVWAVAFNGRSIGSGKSTRWTVMKSIFDDQEFVNGDIILCKDWHKDRRGYFWIDEYEVEF